MVSTSRWKPETRERLRRVALEVIKDEGEIKSTELVERLKKGDGFYRLRSLTGAKLGGLLRGVSGITRRCTIEEGVPCYKYGWEADRER